MAWLGLAAVICLVALFGFWIEEDFAEVLPVCGCVLVLLLYGLAFVRGMLLFDYTVVLLLVAAIVYMVYRGKQKAFWAYLRRQMSQPALLIFLVLTLGIILGVSAKVVSWWDDYNFWATDLKCIYSLNGFASRYANVAPEFGDYPPGTQMFKWWCMHLVGQYSEGAAFAGYYLFQLLFTLPLFAKQKKLNFIHILCPVGIWILPGIADVYGYYGFCADLTMAFLYGAILYAVLDNQTHKKWFYYGRIAVFMSVLVICKSTGFLWTGFAVLFFCGCMLIRFLQRNSAESGKRILLYGVGTCLFPLLSGGAWLLFCLRMHRVTKTTSTAVTYITTDQYGLSAYTKEFAQAFVKAFLTEPLHKTRGGLVNLSPILMLIVLLILFLTFYKKNWLAGREGLFSVIYILGTGMLYYVVIFISHLTIFATETQYLDPPAMVASIERYGVPFVLGSFLCLSHIWLRRNDSNKTLILFLAVVALITNWSAAYEGLITYRKEVSMELETRQEMQGIEEQHLEQALQQLPERMSGTARVFCVQPTTTNYRVRNTYFNYQVSPFSVVASFADVELLDLQTAIWLINSSHATYFYAYPTEQNDAGVLCQLTTDGSFQFEQLYRIIYTDGMLQLEPIYDKISALGSDKKLTNKNSDLFISNSFMEEEKYG